MSAVTVPARPSLTRSSASRRRHAANHLALALMVVAFIVTVIPLALILGYVVVRGMRVMSWSFLTSDIPIVSRAPGGWTRVSSRRAGPLGLGISFSPGRIGASGPRCSG